MQSGVNVTLITDNMAAPLSTFDPTLQTGADIRIEVRKAEEVTHLNGQQIGSEGVQVYNPAFDVTPNELITAIITEKGILKGNFSEGISKLVN